MPRREREREQWGAISYRATCEGCDWRLDARNGQAMAALHYERTGHTVNVEGHGTLTYCTPAESARRRRWRAAELGRFLSEAG